MVEQELVPLFYHLLITSPINHCFFFYTIRMSLLPAGKTFSSPNNPLFATQAELAEVVSNLSTLNVTSGVGSGIDVLEPTLNNFDLSLNLSNAGGLAFLTYPGLNTVGLSNAGVVSLSAGTGIGASASTGAVTVSNTGVTALSAGNGVLLSGGTGNVSVSTPIVPNLVLNAYTEPIAIATTPAGGAITTIFTLSGLVPNKLYMIQAIVGVSANVTDPNKDMSIVLSIPAVGLLNPLLSVPANQNGTQVSTSAIILMPNTPATTINISVATFNFAGGDTASGSVLNACVVALN
jgi:hypothetical protein